MMRKRIISLDEYLPMSNESGNIVNPEVFDLDYVPDKIYAREELDFIRDSMSKYLNRGIARHILLTGPRGSGKTVSMRFLEKVMKKYIEANNIKGDVKFLHGGKSSYELLLSLSQGKPTFKEQMMEKIREISKEQRMIVILDEVDKLRDTEFLYFMTRETNALLVTIAYSPRFLEKLDEATLSSFQPKHIFFPPYNPDDLYEIYRYRCEIGLKHYDDEGVKILSSLVARDYAGDARYGIFALRILGEEDKWDPDSIKNALAEGTKDMEYSILSKLSSPYLEILSLIAGNQTGIRSSDLFHELSEKHGFARSTVSYVLSTLESMGLISTGGKAQGRSYVIWPRLYNPSIVNEILNSR